MNIQLLWSLLKQTYKEWRDDKVPRLAAALSYYTAIAIAPLLVLLVTAVGWFFGTDSAQVQLIGQLQGMVGPQAAEVVEAVVTSADEPSVATFAGIASFLTLLWGASNLFVQLQDSLNTIWGVEEKPDEGFIATVKERFLSFGMILVIGFVMLVSLILSSVLAALGGPLRELIPGMDILWQVLDLVISFAVITLVFALIYKVLPDAEIAWRDVWMGAAATALLFSIGKWLIGIYLGYSSTSSAYGAAGSLLVFLIWVYYSAQIFLFGAEFTQVYASRFGRGIGRDEDEHPDEDEYPDEGVRRDGGVSPDRGAVAQGKASTVKSAALSASVGTARRQSQVALPQQPAATAFANLSLGALVAGLLNDWRTLFRQEIQLAQAEVRENAVRALRSVAVMAGGQVVLYTSVVVLMGALSLLVKDMLPLWLVTLLLGILALIVGAWRVGSGVRALKQLRPMPKQTLETLREDVAAVKEHL